MSHKNINETSTTFHSAIVFGSLKREKREVEYLFLCFSLNSISIMSHKNINETSTTFHSAIVFGFIITQALRALGALGKREKKRDYIICSYVFL